MARFYSNENFARQVVQELRKLGHDVLISFEAGNANRAIPDEEVLSFAAAERRILLSYNRRDFMKLHDKGDVAHAGVILCTVDPQFERAAEKISALVNTEATMNGKLVRVYREV